MLRGPKTRKNQMKNKINKSEYIRRFPKMPAAELAAKAAKEGIQFTIGFVYTVRAQTRARALRKEAAPTKPTEASKARPSSKTTITKPNPGKVLVKDSDKRSYYTVAIGTTELLLKAGSPAEACLAFAHAVLGSDRCLQTLKPAGRPRA